ncbi:MAG: hypothetical protein AAGE01_22305 [Pseudomonadota bacterium]
MPATRTLPILAMLLLAAGCAPPTEDEIRQAEEARLELQEYCEDLREEIDDARGGPLFQATNQERYNRECLGASYPQPGDG